MWVYILKCADSTYYTGVTNDLERRFREHQSGSHAGYTSVRLPVILVFSTEVEKPLDANMLEKKIKKWSQKKKEALIKGDYDLLHILSECKNRTHFRNQH